MKKRFGKVVLLAFLALVALPAHALATQQHPTATPTATPQSHARTVTVTKDEEMLITLINKQRAKHDLAPVKLNANLMEAARAHSTEMASEKYFSHDSRCGESFSQRLRRYGYKPAGHHLWTVGEDIAWGTGLLSSPVAIVDGWMKSPPHRAVILTPRFREIGVGTALSTGKWKDLTDVTFFTLDLGRRK
jgi:uncharacterized protein YkwD